VPVERPRECGAVVRRLEDVSDARLVRPTVRPTALPWIARERRRRAKEDAVKGLMAAPHRLTSDLVALVIKGGQGRRQGRKNPRAATLKPSQNQTEPIETERPAAWGYDS